MEMDIPARVHLADIARVVSEDRDMAFELISEIDLAVADFDFALSVVRHLVESLKSCQDEDDPPLTAEDLGL